MFFKNWKFCYYFQLSPSWTSADPGTNNSNRLERAFTTLLRDVNNSLGFSISGGKGADPFIEGDSSVYISKVAESGPAHRDGKIQVGDKVVQVRINVQNMFDVISDGVGSSIGYYPKFGFLSTYYLKSNPRNW